jgi:type III secretion protein Q
MPCAAHSLLLARLGRDAAMACRCIARRGIGLDVELRPQEDVGASSSTWRLTFVPGMPHSDAQTERVHAILGWGDATLRVGVPPRACSLWLSSRFSGLDIGPLPAPMLDAALEAIAGDIAASLDIKAIPAAVRVLEHGMGAAAIQWPHVWTLSAHSPALRDSFAASLEMNDAGLAQLALALGCRRPVANTLDPDETPVVLRAMLGSTSISAQDLQTSGVGDVILLDRYLADEAGSMWLATPDGQAIQIQARQSRFIIIQGWTSIMNDLNSSTPACGHDGVVLPDNAALHHDLDMDAISINLSFDVGERHIRLGDLRGLQAGEIFDLDRPLVEGHVCIRANGGVVGWGELVDIDGRVGVRILRLGRDVP